MMKFIYLVMAALMMVPSVSMAQNLAQQKEQQLQLQQQESIINHTKTVLYSIERALRYSVYEVANPNYKVRVNKITPQDYSASQYVTYTGISGAAAAGLTFTSLGFLSMAIIPVSLGVLVLTDVIPTPEAFRFDNPHSGKPGAWPHRVKIAYTATNTDRSGEVLTGHCSAYFFNSTNRVNRITLQKEDGKVVGFTAPFEIDGCTHEKVFPENKPGQMRVGGGVDPTDMLLGQAKVVANGTFELVSKAGNKRTATSISVLTDITSHDIQFETKPITQLDAIMR